MEVWQKFFLALIGRIERDLARKTFTCFFPQCSGGAIQSHSQQRLGPLKVIAEGGKVYGLLRNIYRGLKGDGPDSLTLVPLGIRQATTFRGFCAYHDRTVFAAIETTPLVKDRPDQVARLFLRSVAYEYSQKRRAKWFHSEILAERIMLPDQVLRHSEYSVDAIEHALVSDIPFYERLLFQAIAVSEFSSINWRWLIIPSQLPASCCCTFSPLGAQHDEYRLKHWDEPQPMVSFNLIPTEKETHVVLAWARCHDHLCESMCAELDVDLENFVNRVAIAETEDTVFRPSFWLGLDAQAQSAVREAMRHVMYRGELNEIPDILRFGENNMG